MLKKLTLTLMLAAGIGAQAATEQEILAQCPAKCNLVVRVKADAILNNPNLKGMEFLFKDLQRGLTKIGLDAKDFDSILVGMYMVEGEYSPDPVPFIFATAKKPYSIEKVAELMLKKDATVQHRGKVAGLANINIASPGSRNEKDPGCFVQIDPTTFMLTRKQGLKVFEEMRAGKSKNLAANKGLVKIFKTKESPILAYAAMDADTQAMLTKGMQGAPFQIDFTSLKGLVAAVDVDATNINIGAQLFCKDKQTADGMKGLLDMFVKPQLQKAKLEENLQATVKGSALSASFKVPKKLLTDSMGKSRKKAQFYKSKNNLKQMGTAIMMYFSDGSETKMHASIKTYEFEPSHLKHPFNEGKAPTIAETDAGTGDYLVLFNSADKFEDVNNSDRILICEHPKYAFDGKINCLFGDGHVATVKFTGDYTNIEVFKAMLQSAHDESYK